MKVLFVTPSLPYPPRRGYELIAYNHIRLLHERHEIDLISFDGRDGDRTDLGELSEWCGRVDVVALPRWRSLLNLALALPGSTPLTTQYVRSRAMTEIVERRLCDNEYGVVVFYLARMAQYLPGGYSRGSILNLVDPTVLNYQRSLSRLPWYMRRAYGVEIQRLARYEPGEAARFTRTTLISSADVADYRPLLPDARVEVVSYGIDTVRFSASPTIARKPGMIVISGSMFYRPNVEGIEFFCREVFPLVRAHVPSATVWLVGARPARRVRKWARSPGIHVTGMVPDIRPYLNRAMVSVCPVRLSVGIQTKVLEALAIGTPVVTTAAGNYGVGAVDGVHLHVADEAPVFAERVVGLLRGVQWEEMSSAGRAFVERRFAWESSVAALEAVFANVVCDT